MLREHIIFVNMKAPDMIYTALDNLKTHTGITGIFTPHPNRPDLGVIRINVDNRQVELTVIAKDEFRPYQLNRITDLKENNENLLVVANRFYQNTKQMLREQGIAYLETCGNIYLKTGDQLLWIEAQKPLPKDNITNKAFTKTGLRVVFEILQDPGILRLPQREMAGITGVALGQINNVLRGLEQAKFLIHKNKRQFILANARELYLKWVDHYPEKLKARIHMGTFRFVDKDDFGNWMNIPLKPGRTCWGGEPAGYLLTKHLYPARLTIYTAESRQELMQELKLIPDPNGLLEVYEKFWRTKENNTNIAPGMLVYADLMNTGDRRCMETANKIFDEHLKNRFV